eukprot:TRINITY_DN29694_c0_g1_i1.p1 TRINITY_DN29694_c0_g1~~TRINITY_DN29694_c0_g1_i1.p1  ORF type:complete len:637 (-),score=190.21 TRINITY_DN29694_c0_g1_i1:42-1952(-)
MSDREDDGAEFASGSLSLQPFDRAELATDIRMTRDVVHHIREAYKAVSVLKKNRPHLDPNNPLAAKPLEKWSQIEHHMDLVSKRGEELIYEESILTVKVKALLHQFDILMQALNDGRPIFPELVHLRKLIEELGGISIKADPQLIEALRSIRDVSIVGSESQQVSSQLLDQATQDVENQERVFAKASHDVAVLLGDQEGVETKIHGVDINLADTQSELSSLQSEIQASMAKISSSLQCEELDEQMLVKLANEKKAEIDRRYQLQQEEEEKAAANHRSAQEQAQLMAIEKLREIPVDQHRETSGILWWKREHVSYVPQKTHLHDQIALLKTSIEKSLQLSLERKQDLLRRCVEEKKQVDLETKTAFEWTKKGRLAVLAGFEQMKAKEEEYLVELEKRRDAVQVRLSKQHDEKALLKKELKTILEDVQLKKDFLLKEKEKLGELVEMKDAMHTNLSESVCSVLGIKSISTHAVKQVKHISEAAEKLSTASRLREGSVVRASENLAQFIKQVVKVVEQAMMATDLDGQALFNLIRSRNTGDKHAAAIAEILLSEGVDGVELRDEITAEELEALLDSEEIPEKSRERQKKKLLRLQSSLREEQGRLRTYLKQIDDTLSIFRTDESKPRDREEEELMQVRV